MRGVRLRFIHRSHEAADALGLCEVAGSEAGVACLAAVEDVLHRVLVVALDAETAGLVVQQEEELHSAAAEVVTAELVRADDEPGVWVGVTAIEELAAHLAGEVALLGEDFVRQPRREAIGFGRAAASR